MKSGWEPLYLMWPRKISLRKQQHPGTRNPKMSGRTTPSRRQASTRAVRWEGCKRGERTARGGGGVRSAVGLGSRSREPDHTEPQLTGRGTGSFSLPSTALRIKYKSIVWHWESPSLARWSPVSFPRCCCAYAEATVQALDSLLPVPLHVPFLLSPGPSLSSPCLSPLLVLWANFRRWLSQKPSHALFWVGCLPMCFHKM